MALHEGLMKTGEVAALVGVEPQTLRDWDAKKVFVSFAKTTGGHRLYTPEQVENFIENKMKNKKG